MRWFAIVVLSIALALPAMAQVCPSYVSPGASYCYVGLSGPSATSLVSRYEGIVNSPPQAFGPLSPGTLCISFAYPCSAVTPATVPGVDSTTCPTGSLVYTYTAVHYTMCNFTFDYYSKTQPLVSNPVVCDTTLCNMVAAPSNAVDAAPSLLCLLLLLVSVLL
jgi:hypothetical protein